jgi:hypothetical protein
MVDRMMRAGLLLGLSCVAAAAVAQSTAISDPTRPLVGMASGGVPGDVLITSGPVLQSVMVPKKGKPSAMISGQTVMLGENFGESRLIALSEKEAVLEGPGGIERLTLTPGIEKTNVVLKKTATRSAQSKGQP